MTGTILNVVGILLGGIAGLIRPKPLPVRTEAFAKVLLGVGSVFFGLRLAWLSLDGPGWRWVQQLVIAMVSLSLGKVVGRLLGLQKFSNGIGRAARERITKAHPRAPGSAGEGFRTCGALFCAAPLAILGSVQDGLSGYFYPLAIKALMDGLGTRGFVTLFGWGAILSFVPVLAFEGTITLVSQRVIVPFLEGHSSGGHELVNSVNAVGGILVFSVALVILELKKLELADYLPALLFAPVLTRLLT